MSERDRKLKDIAFLMDFGASIGQTLMIGPPFPKVSKEQEELDRKLEHLGFLVSFAGRTPDEENDMKELQEELRAQGVNPGWIPVEVDDECDVDVSVFQRSKK